MRPASWPTVSVVFGCGLIHATRSTIWRCDTDASDSNKPTSSGSVDRSWRAASLYNAFKIVGPLTLAGTGKCSASAVPRGLEGGGCLCAVGTSPFMR